MMQGYGFYLRESRRKIVLKMLLCTLFSTVLMLLLIYRQVEAFCIFFDLTVFLTLAYLLIVGRFKPNFYSVDLKREKLFVTITLASSPFEIPCDLLTVRCHGKFMRIIVSPEFPDGRTHSAPFRRAEKLLVYAPFDQEMRENFLIALTAAGATVQCKECARKCDLTHELRAKMSSGEILRQTIKKKAYKNGK